jgi:stearoyl-CoA desaturase (delta-9 desaturase)
MSVQQVPPTSPSNDSQALCLRQRKTRWGSIVFFALIHSVAFIAAPLYAAQYGISPFTIAFTALYGFLTLLAISVGYHRLFSHSAFKAHPALKLICLYLGAATFQQSALKWSSLHRRHHQLTDTPGDPYNIKFGFWYAHMGWIMFWKQPVDYANVRDLQKDPMIVHQHQYFQAWAIMAGVAVPIAIGALAGHAAEAALFAVALRMTLVYHATFFINSYTHTFGSADYDAKTSARDHWLGALLTNGEGYHNFHHAFPVDYRNGIRWYHWDPAKWIIFIGSFIGLTTDLKRTTPARIEEARRRATEIHNSQRMV